MAAYVIAGVDVTEPEAYSTYSRDYTISMPGKPVLRGSADRAFRGDAARHNPEDLFVAAVAACHMLTYLALCAHRGIHVVRYEDAATGRMDFDPWPGRFTDVVLRPSVTVAAGDVALALRLHDDAQAECFIGNSVRVHIRHEASIVAVR